MADVIPFKSSRADLDPPLPSSIPDHAGNGAGDALVAIGHEIDRTASDPVLIRWAYGLLGNLWEKGVKVWPLEPEDLAG